MPQTIQDADGNDVEVFTASETEAQKQEALDAFKTENPDKTDEIAKLQEDLNKANEDIKGFEDKDQNWALLRKKAQVAEEEAKKANETMETTIKDEIGSAEKRITEGFMQDHYAQTIKSLAGDDEELKKKIEFQYNRLNDPSTTKEDVTKKLTDAWRLATPAETDAMGSTVVSSGGAARINPSAPQEFTDEEKEFGKNFGLTAEDLK